MKTEKAFPDDSFLAEQIGAGDMRAFAILYERYHAYLYHFAFKFLKSPELAEEAVHDVFLKIWEGRSALDSTRSLKGYLIKICKNQVLNQLDRVLRERAWKSELLQTGADRHSDTENAVLLADYEQLAEQAIAALPPQRQRIFRLYRQEEKSLDEIAESLGLSKGTVKDHLLKATRQLRSFMKVHSGFLADMIIVTVLLGEAF